MFSLQATWIRNTIVRALRDPYPEVVKRLSVNFVYQSPSVVALAQYISDLLDAVRGRESRVQPVDKVELLQNLVKKYSANFPARPSNLSEPVSKGDVVFVTGTTGGLGSDILSRLLHDESVARVYAFNRPSEDVVMRQRTSFHERGLNEEDLKSEKFIPVEGDLTQPNFGLASERYAEVCVVIFCGRLLLTLSQICDTVTHILHNGRAPFIDTRLLQLTHNPSKLGASISICRSYRLRKTSTAREPL